VKTIAGFGLGLLGVLYMASGGNEQAVTCFVGSVILHSLD